MHATFALALLAGSAAAFPHLAASNVADKLDQFTARSIEARQDANAWQAPGPDDVRAPCPGMNTLANHGFINRNGRAITKQAVQQAFLDAFNMDFSVTDSGASNSLSLCSQLTGTTCTAFDLDQTCTPHQIEHDASFSRLDKQMKNNLNADNCHFNQGIWDRSMSVFGLGTHVNVSMANTARLLRIAEARQDDAVGWFIENDGTQGAEIGFFMSSMNDESVSQEGSENPQARTDWLNYWFVNQRLPTELGWKKPTTPVSGGRVVQIAGLVFGAPTIAVPTSTPTPTPSSSAVPPPPPPPKTSLSSSAVSSSPVTSSPSKPTSFSKSAYLPSYHFYNTSSASTTSSSSSPLLPGFPGYTPCPLSYPYGSGFSSTPSPTGPSASSVYSSQSSATHYAAASASAQAPPQPQLPNAYFQDISPYQWQVIKGECSAHVSAIQALFWAFITKTGAWAPNAPAWPWSGPSYGGAPPAPEVQETVYTTIFVTPSAPAPTSPPECPAPTTTVYPGTCAIYM